MGKEFFDRIFCHLNNQKMPPLKLLLKKTTILKPYEKIIYLAFVMLRSITPRILINISNIC